MLWCPESKLFVKKGNHGNYGSGRDDGCENKVTLDI